MYCETKRSKDTLTITLHLELDIPSIKQMLADRMDCEELGPGERVRWKDLTSAVDDAQWVQDLLENLGVNEDDLADTIVSEVEWLPDALIWVEP